VDNTKENFYLERWIRDATQYLSDDARVRVTREIEAHFADKLAQEIAQGRPSDEAHAFAMASLGSARTARKAYNWVHINKWDEWRLSGIVAPKRITKVASSVGYVFAALSAMALVASQYYEVQGHKESLRSCVLFFAWSLPIILAWVSGMYGLWASPAYCKRGLVRAAVAWHCISSFSLQFLLAVLPVAGVLLIRDSDADLRLEVAISSAGVLFFGFVYSAFEYWTLARKLTEDVPTSSEGRAR